jgi:hypothetical protein
MIDHFLYENANSLNGYVRYAHIGQCRGESAANPPEILFDHLTRMGVRVIV